MSAVAVLVFAYVIGHIIQSVVQNAFPSKGKDTHGRRRYPSDYFLDSDDDTFSDDFRTQLHTTVNQLFHIDLKVDHPLKEDEVKQVSRARQDAFRMARKALVSSDADSYGQQFQGLYALMRGLAAAFWMGAAYMLGWCFYGLESDCHRWIVLLGWLSLAIAAAIGFTFVLGQPGSKSRMILDRFTYATLLIALCASGAQLAFYSDVSRTQVLVFTLISGACIWCGTRCFAGYKHFADEFARTTWNDFLSHTSTGASTGK